MSDALTELIDKTAGQLAEVIRGGPGSGHHGHEGRPGKVGGSLPDTAVATDERFEEVEGGRIDLQREETVRQWRKDHPELIDQAMEDVQFHAPQSGFAAGQRLAERVDPKDIWSLEGEDKFFIFPDGRFFVVKDHDELGDAALQNLFFIAEKKKDFQVLSPLIDAGAQVDGKNALVTLGFIRGAWVQRGDLAPEAVRTIVFQVETPISNPARRTIKRLLDAFPTAQIRWDANRGENSLDGQTEKGFRRIIERDMDEEQSLKPTFRGGPGSGHHGHEGRPGEVGGSLPSDDDADDEHLIKDMEGMIEHPVVLRLGRDLLDEETRERWWRRLRDSTPTGVRVSGTVKDVDYRGDEGGLWWKMSWWDEGWRPIEAQPFDPDSRLPEHRMVTAVGVAIRRAHYFPDEIVKRGGPGSGHHGHRGRIGQVGGSLPDDGGVDAESFIVDDEHQRERLLQLREELDRWETEWDRRRKERLQSNRYARTESAQLQVIANRLLAQITNAKATGDDEALAGARERRQEAVEEMDARRQWFRIQRQREAINEGIATGKLTVTEEEMAELLAKRGDVYVDARMERPFEYTPELFLVSDLSGRPIRHYIELPDGRITHPDELILSRQRGNIVVIGKPREVPVRDWTVARGGPGSGHHGHAGRPGEVGGSLPSGDVALEEEEAPEIFTEGGRRSVRNRFKPLIDFFEDMLDEEEADPEHDLVEPFDPNEIGDSSLRVFVSPSGKVYKVSDHDPAAARLWLLAVEEELVPEPLMWREVDAMMEELTGTDVGAPKDAMVNLGFSRGTIGGTGASFEVVTPVSRAAKRAILRMIERVEIGTVHPELESVQFRLDINTRLDGLDFEVDEWHALSGDRAVKAFLNRSEVEPTFRGGPGSGHHGHKGRPGEVGGSLPEGEVAEDEFDDEEFRPREGEFVLNFDGDLVEILAENEDGTFNIQFTSGVNRGAFERNLAADEFEEADEDLIDLWTGQSEEHNIERAIEIFGLTDDPDEAGYILPNGSMLNFSGSNQGGSPGTRALDHRDIGQALHEDEPGGTEGMVFFMDEGSIRLHHQRDDLLSLDFAQMPTSAQRRQIKLLAFGKEAVVWDMTIWDADTETFHVSGSDEIDDPDERDIEQMFRNVKTAELGERSMLEKIYWMVQSLVGRGGPGSGHHGHRGRPGEVGGSLPDTAVAEPDEVVIMEPPSVADLEAHFATFVTDDLTEVRGKNFFISPSGKLITNFGSHPQAALSALGSVGFQTEEQHVRALQSLINDYNFIRGFSADGGRVLGVETSDPNRIKRAQWRKLNDLLIALGPERTFYDATTDTGFKSGRDIDDLFTLGRVARSITKRGGPGSGHHGHKGRPGKRGGSLPDKGIRDLLKVPKTERWGDIRHAMDLIDNVHTLSDRMKELPVKESKARKSGGKYRWMQSTNEPLDLFVVLGQDDEWTLMSTVHEIGHWIDHVMIGTENEFDSDDRGGRRLREPEMEEVIELIRASDAFQALRDWKTGVVFTWVDDEGIERKGRYSLDTKIHNMDDRENFVRAYVQWIAQKNNDSRLLRAIQITKDDAEEHGPPLFWRAEEFEPISEAMDALFREGGWLKD